MLVLSIMENPALQAALQAPMEYKNSFAGNFAGPYGIQKQLCRLLWNTKTTLKAAFPHATALQAFDTSGACP